MSGRRIAILILFRVLFVSAISSLSLASDCMPAAVGFRVLHFGGRAVATWCPTTAKPARYAYSPTFSGDVAFNAPAATLCRKTVPLVVFSHGDLGCGLQSIAFTEELARHGYVVAAPTFLCHTVLPNSPTRRPRQPDVFKPETWDDTTFVDRRKDIEAVIDGLLADGEFGAIIDGQRIGAAGHSLGGYTVVGMAGGWRKWLEPRIHALLALSPYVMPFQVQKTLGDVHVPLMYQGGTLDAGITPFLVGPKGAYAAANAPVYFVELKSAAHFAWVNCGKARTTASCLAERPTARLINEYAIAFFDRYLKDMPEPVLEKKNAELAAFDFKK